MTHEAFEAAYRAAFPVTCSIRGNTFEREEDGTYRLVQVQTGWRMWCAAFDAQRQEQPASLAGLEVKDSSFGEWVESGGMPL